MVGIKHDSDLIKSWNLGVDWSIAENYEMEIVFLGGEWGFNNLL